MVSISLFYSLKTITSSIAKDLFGDEIGPPKPGEQQPLWSSLSRRVAGGVTRQAALFDDGSVFVDIRVFNTTDIHELSPYERYDKWSAQLRLRIDVEDPLWRDLKRVFESSRKRFKSEPMYYADKKK